MRTGMARRTPTRIRAGRGRAEINAMIPTPAPISLSSCARVMPKIFSSKRKRCDGTSFTKGFLGYSCIGGPLTNAGEGASKGHLRAYLWKMMPPRFSLLCIAQSPQAYQRPGSLRWHASTHGNRQSLDHLAETHGNPDGRSTYPDEEGNDESRFDAVPALGAAGWRIRGCKQDLHATKHKHEYGNGNADGDGVLREQMSDDHDRIKGVGCCIIHAYASFPGGVLFHHRR